MANWLWRILCRVLLIFYRALQLVQDATFPTKQQTWSSHILSVCPSLSSSLQNRDRD
jgi:hypothetical protein